jgi:putative colanic acid biosynthesis UDP-glucose lipid carrier transferase
VAVRTYQGTEPEYQPPVRLTVLPGKYDERTDRRADLQSIVPVADLMLAAAHADDHFCECERHTVHGLLCQLTGTETLPELLEKRISRFDPRRFDLQSTAEAFVQRSAIAKRRLLELIRLVCEADASVDLRENHFMQDLVLALGMAPAEYRDLVVEESKGVNGWPKRLMDILIGVPSLMIAALPMLAIALAVKLSSPGPVFFRQKRYGLGGEEIEVTKFRTMYVQDPDAPVKQARQHDERITPLGRFLRRTSLDELPQLINVVRGDMSPVGPRPHAIPHNQQYRVLIPEYMLRHKIKPGITGWAQVNGWRGETDTLRKMEYRVEHDLDYIRRWSPWLDLKILWLTVFGRKVRTNAW